MGLKGKRNYSWANLFGVTYTLCLIVALYAIILFFTCPATFEEGDECRVGNYVGIVIVAEIVLNMILFLVYSRLVIM